MALSGCSGSEAPPARALFPAYSGPVEAGSIEGVWKGNLRLAGMDHTIVSTITRGEGGWHIVYDNPDMGETGLVAEDVRLESGRLTFDIPNRGATFLGEMSRDGKGIDGRVRMLGREIALDLVLVDMPGPAEDS